MIENKAEFNLTELLHLFGESSLVNFGEKFTSTGVIADTRQIKEGNIFVALKGERVDSHKLISEAFSKGATAVIIDESRYEEVIKENPNSPIIKVKDVVEALGKLANFHRRRFDIPIIAIGGSNGKTTTKDMISTVLEQKFQVLRTFENFNNQIGVPLMLLALDKSHEIAVLEIGTNSPGEIMLLSEMIEPTHGLITNIGKEHLEQLLDIAGVELEETYLFGYLRARGVCYLNDDDERLRRYGEVVEKFRRYGTGEHVETKGIIELDEELKPKIKIKFEDEVIDVAMQTFGMASAKNALAAASVGFSFEIAPEQVKAGLESYKPWDKHGYGRMTTEIIGDLFIINDTYNSNPGSMTIALENLKAIKRKGRKVAIFGDMRELGEASQVEHEIAIQDALEVADSLILFGDEFAQAVNKFSDEKINAFANKIDLLNFIKANIQNGDTILVKGSRGLKMEEAVEVIRQNFA